MPLHERAQLRAAILAQLVAANTAAGSRVSYARQAPLVSDLLPVISVYMREETTTDSSKRTAPRELKRDVAIAVEAWVVTVAGGDIDAEMDAIALEIETAMDGDRYLDSCAFDSVLTATEFGRSMEGARPMGCVILQYDVAYHTNARITAPVNQFDKMGTTTDLAGAQAVADETSTLTEDIHE